MKTLKIFIYIYKVIIFWVPVTNFNIFNENLWNKLMPQTTSLPYCYTVSLLPDNCSTSILILFLWIYILIQSNFYIRLNISFYICCCFCKPNMINLLPVTGLVCSAILRKLSKKANNVKEQVLSNDLEEHSK